MNHSTILKRAWENVWRYRALWVFGIILALTTSSWMGTSFYDRDDEQWEGGRVQLHIESGDNLAEVLTRTYRIERAQLRSSLARADREIDEFFREVLDIEFKSNLAAILTAVAISILAVYLTAKMASYVSETALIRMVNDYEETDQKLTARQGLRLGWSRSAWRLFLIDLIITLPLVTFFTLTVLLFITSMVFLNDGNVPAGAAGAIVSGGLLILGIFVALAILFVLSLVKPLMRRACVLEDLGSWAAISRGLRVARQHLKDAGLTWLVMVGIRVSWPLLLAPVILAVIAVAIMLAILAAVLAGGVTTLTGGVAPVVAAVVGATTFMLVLIAPLAFLGGLREVFLSSMWTLTYREMHLQAKSEKVTSTGTSISDLKAATVS